MNETPQWPHSKLHVGEWVRHRLSMAVGRIVETQCPEVQTDCHYAVMWTGSGQVDSGCRDRDLEPFVPSDTEHPQADMYRITHGTDVYWWPFSEGQNFCAYSTPRGGYWCSRLARWPKMEQPDTNQSDKDNYWCPLHFGRLGGWHHGMAHFAYFAHYCPHNESGDCRDIEMKQVTNEKDIPLIQPPSSLDDNAEDGES